VLFQQRFTAVVGAAALDGYDVVVCTSCGFVYADGIPSQASLDLYYRDLSKYENSIRDGRESSFDSKRFLRTAEAIRQGIPSRDSRILEIGCSTGGLLAALREMGFRNVLGLDPSPACTEYARRVHGIPVLTGALSDMPELEETDFVIMVAVLEHIHDLAGALHQIRQLLTPSGRVYVEVPDAARFSMFRGAPFQQFSIEHINFFSARSLTDLMSTNGFGALSGGHEVRASSETGLEPVVYGIFEVAAPTSMEIVPDWETEKAVLDYIEHCSAADAPIRTTIDELVAEGLTILVWGVGTHTQRLLASGNLARANIAAFVDSNPKYQGKQLNGVPVLSPDALKARPEPILISSQVFEHEIVRQIREDLRLDNKVITLYGD
jgi:SAM-dependent methyltransferase